MANSTISVGTIVLHGKTFPDVAPILQTAAGGSSLQPSLTICNDTMIEIISDQFNWKWNRLNLPVFYTNSWQQDYALNVVNLGWLEGGWMVDINNTSTPKPIWPLEAVKDLPPTSVQWGIPQQVCWTYNKLMQYGTWAASATFINPIGVTGMPSNPLTQIADPNGNLWVVTTYGTTGSSQPSWPTVLVYPTPQAPNATATTVTDGSVTWTALNPNGQGIRCNPLPPQAGVVYQFNIFGQYRPLAFCNGNFTNFDQTIEPIPDDFAKAFRDGFVAMAYAHSPEKGIREKHQDMHALWIASLQKLKIQGGRERENNGFYPSTSVINNPYAVYPGPAYPFPIPQA